MADDAAARVERLIATLQRSPSAWARADAAEELARVSSPTSHRALRAALRDPDRFVREQALQSLIDLYGLRGLLLAHDGDENNQSPLGRLLLLVASERPRIWNQGATEVEGLLDELDGADPAVAAAVRASLVYVPGPEPGVATAFSRMLRVDRVAAQALLPAMAAHDRAWADAYLAIHDPRRDDTAMAATVPSPLLKAFLDSLDAPPDPRDRRDSYAGVDFFFRLNDAEKETAAAALIERIARSGDRFAIHSAAELQLPAAREVIERWQGASDPLTRNAAVRALKTLP